MNVDLKALENQNKLLFEIELKPVQGHRFQPTGFPSLGAATYQTKDGQHLLVESPQSMANRFETVCWDDVAKKPVAALEKISYIRVERKEKGKESKYLTSSIMEAHRINSPYILEGSDDSFIKKLKSDLAVMTEGPIDRKLLAEKLLLYDAGSLLHGVFLAKKELAGGRLRVARALSAFIEADGVRPAVSGGVKNDHVNPSGDTKSGFGNVPFSREEFVADRLALYINLDLAQIRGYGLGKVAESLLILLALFKIRAVLDADLDLRTACKLEKAGAEIEAKRPEGFMLPARKDIESALKEAAEKCSKMMTVTTVHFDDELKKGKSSDGETAEAEAADENEEK